jgi:hypothetical protein
LFDINSSGDIDYPLMWVVPPNGSISGNIETLDFSIIIMDIEKKGGANRNDIYSDVLEISKDVVAQLSHQNYGWFFDANGVNLESFSERFTDDVTGWTFNVGLQLDYSADRCVIPYDGTTSEDEGTGSCTGIVSGSAAGTIRVYLNGILQSTTASSNLDAEIVNILWT